MRNRFALAQRLVAWLPCCALLSGCYSGIGFGDRDDGAGAADDDGADDGDGDGDGDGGDGGDGADDGEGEEAEDPGRVTLHRLNRAEYNNTIRDLFWGLAVAPADDFPADDHSFGFDNIADVLSVTPLLFELYERATDDVLDLVFAPVAGATVRAEAETGDGDVGQADGDYWLLTTQGAVTTTIEVETAGDYTLRVRAYGEQAGPDLPLLQMVVDGAEVGEPIAIDAVEATPGEYEVPVTLAVGPRQIGARFTNDYYDPDAGADRNVWVDWIEIEGAGAIDPGAVDVRANLLTCEPVAGQEADCTRAVLEPFVERAWRRPLADSELDDLVALAESARLDGDSWEDSLRQALKAVLLSPHFLFRVEIDPDPEDLQAHPLGQFELASRLSYFLWSSMPDDELLAAARAGTLDDPDELSDHVARMLDDERALALVDNFAGQWLYFRAIEPGIVKDATYYPGFDDALAESMRTETELFFTSFVEQDRSLRELLTAQQTWIDARLAEVYGLPAPGGTEFSQVSLSGVDRSGILTMPGLMTVLSHPDASSPVKRGKWILEQLLCIPPAPPPPGVEADPPSPDPDASVREQLEQHRADPQCAACHDLIDPLGLGLEHYDAIGGFRTIDGGKPIDASGWMPDGTEFADGLEMAAMIADSDDFTACTVRKTLTYALGRGVGLPDIPYLEEITQRAEAGGFTLRELVLAITGSDVFRMRRGEEVSP